MWHLFEFPAAVHFQMLGHRFSVHLLLIFDWFWWYLVVVHCYCSCWEERVTCLCLCLYCHLNMPKETRELSLSFGRSRLSPFPCRPSCSNPPEDDENIKEWEDTRCPVCMEHPHNAILLICSSHKKGCRPFMCDTSYRHSNCFDQFQKSFGEASAVVQRPEDTPNSISPLPVATTISEVAVSDLEGERSPEGLVFMHDMLSENSIKPKLVCPLCRGFINGWTVMESARSFMNAKSRSCACETCDFSGSYTDLRKHARLIHPLVRPMDADPERQRNWRRLEQQRDLGDLVSTLQSSIGEQTSEESTLTIDEDGWLTVFFLVRFIRPRSASSTSRANAQVALRRRRPARRFWGETIDGILDSRDNEIESSDGGQTLPRHYTRRHLHDQENVVRESRDNESSDSEQGFPRRYVRRRLNNQENQ